MNNTIGIGIDMVEVERFAHWHQYPKAQLIRIFSNTEIEYCLSSQALSAQRFAARFAAREAFLKALSAAYPDHRFALLTICKSLEISQNPNGSPLLIVNWSMIMPKSSTPIMPICALSWTHTRTTATAIVHMSL